MHMSIEGPSPQRRTEFIPGRPEGAYARRVIKTEHGVSEIGEQAYEVITPEGEAIPLGPDDLAAAGIETEGATTIQASDPEYPNLIEAAYRKREGTTRREWQAALRDAIRQYEEAAPAQPQEDPAQALEAEPVDGRERWEHREGAGNGEERRAEEVVQERPAQEPREAERPHGPEPHEPREKHEKAHSHDKSHDGHDHGHGHDHHGEPWHMPRNRYELEEMGIAAWLAFWGAIKAILKFHVRMNHAFGYILTGDNKHPWQTLKKNITSEFKKGLGLKGGGGGGHGGGGHEHGGGHH